MAESSSNTIDSVNTLVEALRYASNLVDDTDGQVGVTYEFLSTYDYYGTIDLAVPLGTKIHVPLVELATPDMSKYYSYTQESMANYFYLNTDASSSGTNTMSEKEGVAPARQMLTQETLLKYSLVSGGAINLPTAYYADGVSFDQDNDDDDTVIPLSVARALFYDVSSTIPVSDFNWGIYVKVGTSTVFSPVGRDYITVTGANIKKPIDTDEVVLSSTPKTFSEMLSPFVGPELEIDYDAQIPEELMHHNFNMLTGRELRSNAIYKAGATVSLTMIDEMNDTELLQLMDDYFTSSGYFALYEDTDMMLTHSQAELLVEHIVKRVMSVNDLGLQI